MNIKEILDNVMSSDDESFDDASDNRAINDAFTQGFNSDILTQNTSSAVSSLLCMNQSSYSCSSNFVSSEITMRESNFDQLAEEACNESDAKVAAKDFYNVNDLELKLDEEEKSIYTTRQGASAPRTESRKNHLELRLAKTVLEAGGKLSILFETKVPADYKEHLIDDYLFL